MKPFSIAFVDALPYGVVAGVHLPTGLEPVPPGVLGQLPPAERQHAVTLRGFRQVDWVGGRLALHRAIRTLGRKPGAVLVGPRGEPQGPPGVTVTVSHKRGLAVALAARGERGHVGIDLEDLGPARDGIAPRVLTPEELAAVQALPPERRWVGVLLRFCFKEAIYKAIHPYVNRYVDFMEASVHPDPDGYAALALALKDGEGPFELEGRYYWLGQRVLAVVRASPVGMPTPDGPEDPPAEGSIDEDPPAHHAHDMGGLDVADDEDGLADEGP